MMSMPRVTIFIAPALLLGLLFFSCRNSDGNKPAGAGARIVATVNDEPITLAEFTNRFNHAGLKAEPGSEREVKRDFLNRLIERAMMLHEARKKRIEINGAELDKRMEEMRLESGKNLNEELSGRGIDIEQWKTEVRDDMMIERLLAVEVSRRVEVSQDEVQSYYKMNSVEFERPAQVRVRQIVVATEQEARNVLRLLHQKGDFASLAREQSKGPEAEQGGDLGYFAKGEMPAEFDVVFRLPVGGTSRIVKSPYGFHIFRLEDKRRAGRIGFDEASPGITNKLRQEKENREYLRWLQELRSRTKFEVSDEAFLDQ